MNRTDNHYRPTLQLSIRPIGHPIWTTQHPIVPQMRVGALVVLVAWTFPIVGVGLPEIRDDKMPMQPAEQFEATLADGPWKSLTVQLAQLTIHTGVFRLFSAFLHHLVFSQRPCSTSFSLYWSSWSSSARGWGKRLPVGTSEGHGLRTFPFLAS